MRLRPAHDLARAGNDIAAVEHEDRHGALAGELLHLGAILGAFGQRPELQHSPFDLLVLVLVAGRVQRFGGAAARVRDCRGEVAHRLAAFACIENHSHNLHRRSTDVEPAFGHTVACRANKPARPVAMILSVHIADVGPRAAARLLRDKPERRADGLRYSEIALGAPLGVHLLPRLNFGRVGLIACWEQESQLERFLAGDRLARALSGGWHVRLQPLRMVGGWRELEDLPRSGEAIGDSEPVAVITLARIRLSQLPRFLRASAGAEGQAVADPAAIVATGLGRPTRFAATFSLWRNVAEMRAYVTGRHGPEHANAMRRHAAEPFHHESAFLRLRPYTAEGTWDGREPLSEARHAAAGGDLQPEPARAAG